MRLLGTLIFISLLASPALAQTNTVVSEASYLMGEGETPAEAESKALDAAKQKALEQLLVFVEEQTKQSVQQFQPQQVKAIAEATLEIEVLEKKRTVVGERFQFSTRIRASQRQDRIQSEVARKEKRFIAEKLTKEASLLSKEKSDFTGALERLNQAIQADPTFAHAFFDRYLLYKYKLSLVDEALADLTEAVRLEPQTYLFIRGEHYEKIGNTEQALHDFTEAIKLERKAWYLWKRGGLYEGLGRYREAIDDFTSVLQMPAEPPGEVFFRTAALQGRGSAYHHTGIYDLALADYTELIRLTNGKEGYGARGLVYMSMKEPERAIQDFTRALIQESQSPSNNEPSHLVWVQEIYYMRALAYSLMGQHEKVVLDLTEYLHRGQTTKKQMGRAYELRGAANEALQQPDKALADYSEAVRLNPNPSAYFHRGVIYGGMALHQRVLEDMTEALRLNLLGSSDPQTNLKEVQVTGVYVLRGWAYLQLSDPDRALSEFSQALRRDPALATALLGRGLAHTNLRNSSAAKNDLQRACSLKSAKACEALRSLY